MSGFLVRESVDTAYEAFLAGLGHESSAAECLEWAARHAGDREEGRALVDAGWLTAREGLGEEALGLFHRAAELGGEFRRDAHVGIVDQLYALRRAVEAEAAQRALWAELEARPGGVADLRVFDDITEALSDAGEHRLALEWCQAGLDYAAEVVDRAGEAGEVERYRRGLLISRGFLREELGLELDEDDAALRAEADASVAAVRELIERKLDVLSLDLPVAGEPFDGIVLRWVREDFGSIRSRWPEETAHYGDDYAAYAMRVQREARGYARAGAGRVYLVSGTLADYEVFARREGRDPALQPTRRDYGEWVAISRPREVPLWPPARNAPCWCDSGRKYKKCCGEPAKN